MKKSRSEADTRAIDLSRADWNDLLGKWFHTLCAGGRVSQQGQVIGTLGHGFYVVRFFDWFVGMETCRRVVHVSDMRKGRWALYESDESMREHYEHAIGVSSHETDSPCTCQKETV